MRDDISFFDLHVHVAPDTYRRKYSVLSLGEEMKNNGGGAVIKSHLSATTGMASMARQLGYPVYGSVVLNKYAGGIDTSVVQAAIAANGDAAPMIIYFPTLIGAEHRGKIIQEKSHKVLEASSVCGEKVSCEGRLRKEAIEVIKLASHYKIPMATGHSLKEDVLLLVEEAEKNNGCLMLTHPFHPFIDFSMSEIVGIMKNYHVYLEVTILTLQLDYMKFEDLVQLIELIGDERLCISSDLGQVYNITVSEGYKWFARRMKEMKPLNSLIEIENLIEKICCRNPMKFMGVDS